MGASSRLKEESELGGSAQHCTYSDTFSLESLQLLGRVGSEVCLWEKGTLYRMTGLKKSSPYRNKGFFLSQPYHQQRGD